jgi:hypothetical protein
MFLVGPAGARAADPGPVHLNARSNYLERCGGCHGVRGQAFTATVPDLKGRAGWFLCAPAGRDYVGRLPNIVFSGLSDSELAELINYAVLDLGGDGAPKGAKPFTAEEVAKLRHRALTITDLQAYRARVVAGLIESCGAPGGLASDYAPVPDVAPAGGQ